MSVIERINAAAGMIVPEFILLGTAVLTFLIAPFLISQNGRVPSGLRNLWAIVSLIALGAALCVTSKATLHAVDLSLFRVDAFVQFVRFTSLSIGVILVLLLWNRISDELSGEAQACLLTILAGINLTAAANDLATIFIGLEMVSIPTYIILYLPKQSRQMREATVKYFLLSVFSAAMFLYGVAWLFGAAGTTNLHGIALAAEAGKFADATGYLLLAQVFLIAGLSFRMTLIPFHFYAPDVFEGSTPANAAMLSFIPKLAGIVALFRLIPLTQGAVNWDAWTPSEPVQTLLATLAVLTMFLGNLMALRQTNLHRLLAYSSVAHAGYMMVGFTVGGESGIGNGLAAVLFYLIIYGIMTLGVFAVLTALGNYSQPIRSVNQLAGLSRTNPWMAALLCVLLLSLTGIPPTAGMLGKLFLFMAAWNDGSTIGYTLAIMLAINAAIAASYYLRLIGVMYFVEAQPEAIEERPTADSMPIPAWVASVGCVVCVLWLFFVPQGLWDAALRAVQS